MSALRISGPDGIRLVDLGPATPAPLRGFSHRPHGIPGGSFCRPLPTPEREQTDKRRAQVAAAAARYRARQAEEAAS